MGGWMIRGRVRVIADVEVGNTDPHSRRKYRAGEELEMILRGHPGEPLSSASWWSSTDVDLAHILAGDQVEVLDMLGPTWVKCGGCGAGGEILRHERDLPYLDVGGRIAQQRNIEQAKASGV
ncbi:hypothetical protein [Streptomyces sp. NPDC047070]|uniref:hypothetical protein n=1 Tax=Streptomyces sp. NPDC047070 TaxID=3154923 RepID=UPI0034553FF2